MPDDLREHPCDVAARDHQLLVIAVDRRGHLPLELRLIVFGVLKADGVRPEHAFLRLPTHPRGDRTVKAAREIAADRNIRPENSEAGGLLELLGEGFSCLVQRERIVVRGGHRVGRTPEHRIMRSTVPVIFADGTRREFLYAPEE